MTANCERLPWHSALWAGLEHAMSQKRLAHAFLLAGSPGLGKRQFAAQLAQALLCSTPDGLLKACGRCHACLTVQAGTHPDLVRLGLSEDSKVIKVEDLREFTRRLFLTSEQAQGKVSIVDPADAMNMSASNALLKTLEEPPSGAHILLIADRPMLLPATIRSRCQLLRFSSPEKVVALSWMKKHASDAAQTELGYARGAPLLAATMAEEGMPSRRKQWKDDLESVCQGRASPLAVAERWQKEDLAALTGWLHDWLVDVTKLSLGLPSDQLASPGQAEALQAYATGITPQGLAGLSVALTETVRMLDRQVSMQLVLENLLVSWYQECKTVRKTA